MAVMLGESVLFKGLLIQNDYYKVSMFADDTVIFTNGNLSQFK